MADSIVAEKNCSKCAQTLSADRFYRSPRGAGGLTADCRACRSEWERERRRLRPVAYAPDLPGEKWRPVLGYEVLYSVSNRGRVRREKPAPRTRVGYILHTFFIHGYPATTLHKGGVKKKRTIHTLVAEAFISPRPSGQHVNHKDGDKTNCRPENLEYVTPRENARHAVKTGLYPFGERHSSRTHPERVPRGEKNGTAKLTDAQAKEIRVRYTLGGVTQRQLAHEYGIDQAAVWRITSGKGWKHI